ncbi:MAG: ATP-binding protein [Bradyrhizobium sp.]
MKKLIGESGVKSLDSDVRFLAGTGEMGAFILQHDWSTCSLGGPKDWPQGLKTALTLLLRARTQIVLFWGLEYIAFYNDAYAPTIGNKHPQALGRPARENWSELWDDLEPLLRSVRETGETFFAKNRPFIIERHGYLEHVFFDVSYSAVPDESGNVGGILCLVNETTDQVLADRRLRESEERFRLVAESAPVMLWMSDEIGKCVYLNRAQRNFWNVPPEKLSVFDWSETIHPEDKEKLFVPFERGMRERSGFAVEARFRRANGEYRTLHTNAEPRFEVSGKFLGMIGVNVDVTDSRRTEEALRQEARVLEIVNQAGAAIAAELDVETIVQKITDAGVALTDAEFGAFFYNVIDENGESYTLYTLSGVPREAFSKFPMPRNTLVFGPTFRGEAVVRSGDITKDPRYGKNAPYYGMPKGHLPVRSHLAVPVKSRSGDVLGGLFFGHSQPNVFRSEHEQALIGIAGQAATAIDNARLFQSAGHEIAERRRAEEAMRILNATLEERVTEEVAQRSKAEAALMQAQKAEAIGQLTGGIAHDFNNMLAVVIGALNLLRRRLAKGDTDVAKYVEGALDGANRAASLTQRLLAFARQQPLAPRPLDVNRLIFGMSELLTRALGEQVKLETVLSAGLWKTNSDPVQLENAILNLCVNARDAMPSGGNLTIETANAHVDDDYARTFEVPPGQYILISVTDEGVGMPPEIATKAFDPFFTTKGVGKGTGLGLSQVFGFVRQSGGYVKIYSELKHGTTVKTYLPRHYGEAALPEPRRPSRATGRRRSNKIILVVEDDERVRAYAVEALRELGYTVLDAENGAQALKLLDKTPNLHLLFTDIVMPEMTGRELADLARGRMPSLKVLYMTGYTRNAVVHNGMLDHGTNFLPKPFSIDQLASKVRDVLDSD